MSAILNINFLTVVDETPCHVHIIARIVSKLIGTVASLHFCSEKCHIHNKQTSNYE